MVIPGTPLEANAATQQMVQLVLHEVTCSPFRLKNYILADFLILETDGLNTAVGWVLQLQTASLLSVQIVMQSGWDGASITKCWGGSVEKGLGQQNTFP